MANKRTVGFGVGFSVNTFIRARWGEMLSRTPVTGGRAGMGVLRSGRAVPAHCQLQHSGEWTLYLTWATE